jgi:hypothetical protein
MSKTACVFLLATALAAAAIAGEESADSKKAPAVQVLAVGQKAPAIRIKDTTGRTFELLDAGLSRKEAVAMVQAAAHRFGAPENAKLETTVASLSGVQGEDGSVEPEKLRDLAVACGEPAGLTATSETAAAFKTLGDLADWVASANDAPIVLLTWSPNCPSIRKQNDRIVEAAARGRFRIFALACNAPDTDAAYAKFHDTYEWNVRVFPDRKQRVTDLLGGKATPHFFVFDTHGVLRYRGALDNDPMGYMEPEERKEWVLDAVKAIRAGKDLAVKETDPSG